MDNNQRPLISAVIPNCNQGYYLEACIRSIICQSYESVELILVDGGSTDNSNRVINRYRSHFAYIQQGPDGGQYNAINQGFSQARGDIYFWLNSDDMLHPGALISMVEAVVNHADVHLFTGYPCVWDEADRLKMVRRESPEWSYEYFKNFDPESPSHYMQQESTFFTRQIWEKVGGLDSSIGLAADFDLWLRMSKHTDIVKIPRLVGGFRQHGQQRSVLNRDQYIAQVKSSIKAESQRECISLTSLTKYAVHHPAHTNQEGLVSSLSSTQSQAITLLTSISPRGIASQRDAITTWIENGFRVISVNDHSESDQLATDFPDVEFHQPSSTLKAKLGKPYVPIYEVLSLAASIPGASAVINSDIKFIQRTGMETILRELASSVDQHVYVSSRLDITNPIRQISSDNAGAGIPAITSGEQYIFGFDFLLANSGTWTIVVESMNKESDRFYALGVPWWDYLLPMRIDGLGIGLSCFCPPIISHDWHTANYSREIWREYGQYYALSEFGYGQDYDGKLLDDAVLEALAAQTIRHLQLSMADVSFPNYSMPLTTGMLDTVSGYARSQMPLSTAHRFRISCI